MARAAKSPLAEEVDDSLFPAPEQRMDLVGHEAVEQTLRLHLDSDTLTNGWMIVGPDGIGKATLAWRIARAYLDRDALLDETTLSVDPDGSGVRLVNYKGHPDLFLAERRFDEKKGKRDAEIKVDTIRELGAFLSRTASTGRRVAIVDRADDLNRSAANAFLKSLEEPPAGTLLLLLVAAPGRLLPTIRSRCRVVDLMPVETSAVANFIATQADISHEDATLLASVSEGRPGYGLQLAYDEGAEAVSLSEKFITASLNNSDLSFVTSKLAARGAEQLWFNFRMILLQTLSKTARAKAAEQDISSIPRSLSSASVPALLKSWEEIRDLTDRGTALNLDRTQMIITIATRLREILSERR